MSRFRSPVRLIVLALMFVTLWIDEPGAALSHQQVPKDEKEIARLDPEIARLEAEIVKRIENGTLLRTRKQWPSDVQPRAQLDVSGLDTRDIVILEVLTCAGEPITARWFRLFDRPNLMWRDETFNLPADCWQNGEFHLLIRLSRSDGTSDEFTAVTEAHAATIAIEFAIEGNQEIQPDENHEVTEAIRTRTKVDLVKVNDRAIARVSLPEAFIPRDLAFGADIFFFDSEVCIARTQFYCNEQIRSSVIESNLFLPVEIRLGEWEVGKHVDVMIVSNRSIALRDLEAEKYWVGGCKIAATIK
jgi:hypothetical protein